ncbi:MAG: homoserine O-succinyltransferase [Polyangiaceae bacterium]|jgi:homoserine O-succinyltransferase
MVAHGQTDGGKRPIRIGIINIMPKAEAYESSLLRPLVSSGLSIEPIWVRLKSHRYGSSDARHIETYRSFEDAMATGPLDGMILTGAPVEELAFEKVSYWRELSEVLDVCRSRVTSTVGLCWGGLALAKMLGIEKCAFGKKLFGVFENRNLAPGHWITGAGDSFWCAHSRHSGIASSELEAARDVGLVNLLSHGSETGYSIFESADRAYVAHLGHPEYEAMRLVREWERDVALGRKDVAPPSHVDLAHPTDVWRSHCTHFFSQWLHGLTRRRPVIAGDEAVRG